MPACGPGHRLSEEPSRSRSRHQSGQSTHRASPDGVHPGFVSSVYRGRMVRKRSEPQPPLPFGTPAPASVEPASSAPKVAEVPPNRGGRPRKWATEAERKRAYRERLATDHAEPDRLRRELRAERKRVAERERRLATRDGELARAQTTITNQAAQRAELEATVERLKAKIVSLQKQANQLGQRLAEERERAQQRTSASQQPASRGPGQRRELRLPPPAVGPGPPVRRRSD